MLQWIPVSFWVVFAQFWQLPRHSQWLWWHAQQVINNSLFTTAIECFYLCVASLVLVIACSLLAGDCQCSVGQPSESSIERQCRVDTVHCCDWHVIDTVSMETAFRAQWPVPRLPYIKVLLMTIVTAARHVVICQCRCGLTDSMCTEGLALLMQWTVSIVGLLREHRNWLKTIEYMQTVLYSDGQKLNYCS